MSGDAEVTGAWSKRRHVAYQASVGYDDFVSLSDQIHDAHARVGVKDAIIAKLEQRRDDLTATVALHEGLIVQQREQLHGAAAEIERLRRLVSDANLRAEDADACAQAAAQERDDAVDGLDAANGAAAEEAAKRGVAWDMGKQHALTLMMESVAARSGNLDGMYGPAVNGGYLGGGYALAAATGGGGAAPGKNTLRSSSSGGAMAMAVGAAGAGRHSGHRSGPGQPGIA